MKEKLKDLLCAILIVLIILVFVSQISFYLAKAIIKFEEEQTVTTSEVYCLEIPNKTEYTYVICDVVYYYGDTTEDIYATNLVCEMPNGELHTYTIEDAPEGNVELVCFRTDNQDDYEAYEIIAVR